MNHPRITVVTPSFNQGHFLREAIDSVLDQEYPNLEYIVMDGGSTDGSVQILREVEESLAHWESKPDGGQGAAIIDGWVRSSGDLLTWLNSDDVMLPGSLAAAARAFDSGADIVIGDFISIDESGTITSYSPLRRGPQWMYRSGLLTVGQPGTFYRRSSAEKVGYFDRSLQFSMEYDLILKLLGAGATMRHVTRPLAALRRYAETKTSMYHDAFADELRGVYSKHIHGIFQVDLLRRATVHAERYPYALRYLLPSNLPKTAQKIRWARHPTRVKDVQWQDLD